MIKPEDITFELIIGNGELTDEQMEIFDTMDDAINDRVTSMIIQIGRVISFENDLGLIDDEDLFQEASAILDSDDFNANDRAKLLEEVKSYYRL